MFVTAFAAFFILLLIIAGGGAVWDATRFFVRPWRAGMDRFSARNLAIWRRYLAVPTMLAVLAALAVMYWLAGPTSPAGVDPEDDSGSLNRASSF